MDWIIPCNVRKYDVESAFSNLPTIDWRQNANIAVGDSVYIYCGKPLQKILFKTIAIETGISPSEVDASDEKYNKDDSLINNTTSQRYMRLKPVQYFGHERLCLKCLKEHGLYSAPQGPMRVVGCLSEYINNFNLEDQSDQFYIDGVTWRDALEGVYEGAITKVYVNKYERSLIARQKCIEANGCYCHICGLNFEEQYGKIGKDFIHVHHKVPLNNIKEEYVVDPVNDLIPVCPNCHALLHRKLDGRHISVEELKSLITDAKHHK